MLWLVFAFWIGLFVAVSCGCIRRWGKLKAAWLIPIIWTGIEYFRSELYYLKFSWLNIGYALPAHLIGFWVDHIGMYGAGFLVVVIATLYPFKFLLKLTFKEWILVIPILVIALALLFPFDSESRSQHMPPIVGVQMEFPPERIIPQALDHALAKNTNAQIFVLSEYTLDGPVPGSLTNWCREHSRFLVVGGKDPVGTNNFYDTAFVVGTNGDIIFKRAKCVPIQFFKDGLPATNQAVWNSPWGKIGFCICYDLSYTRVTDRLVKEGAQLLIVPTMDVADWGRHEHELHSRVAPVRAAEYGIPIFRLASSGISQAVDDFGSVIAQTSIGGSDEILAAQLHLPSQGHLPLDRFLAPFCVMVTGIVTALLLYLTWKDKNHRAIQPPPSTTSS